MSREPTEDEKRAFAAAIVDMITKRRINPLPDRPPYWHRQCF